MTRRRRVVVVYITRENPATGADQLLVFDVVERPEYIAVVPGGGIELGEPVEEAARREAHEETGLEIRILRILGVADHPGVIDPGYIHETHFVHATPIDPTEDEWEHRNPPGIGVESEELVSCRWVPLRADLRVWGYRGALVHLLLG